MTQKGFAVIYILIGLLFLIAFSGGVYYYYKNYVNGHHETVTKNATSPSTKESTPSPVTLTKTEGWITYSNLNQGFSVEYPPSWSVVSYHYDWKSFVQVSTDFNYEPSIALTPNLNKDQLEKSVGYLPGVEIEVSNLQECTNPKDYINENLRYYQESYKNDPSFKNAYPDFKLDDLNVKNIDGFIVTGLPGPGGRESLPTAYIFNCPMLMTILFDGSNIPNGTQIFHQMLSTVKVWKPVKITPG